MAQLLNSFENTTGTGANGNSITPTNSDDGAAGNGFDAIASTGTRVYDTSVFMNGTRSALASAPTSGNTASFAWSESWTASATTYFRMYARFSDATVAATTTTLALFRPSTDTGIAAELRLTSGGNLQLRAPQTERYTSSAVLNDNTWYRIEVAIVCTSSTQLRIQARIYEGNSTTLLEQFGSLTSGTWTAGDGEIGGVSFGIITSAGQNDWSMNIDDVGLSDVDWLGSAVPPAPAVPQNLTATAVSETQINLGWTAFAGATGYDIERNGTVIVTDHVGTTYNDTGLTPATQYNYRVRAVL
jgi:hypothetical protein